MRLIMFLVYSGVLVGTFQGTAGAQSNPQLVPLQEYIGHAGVEKDPVAMAYVAARCSALYMTFAKNLERETDPERLAASKNMYNLGEKLMGKAASFNMIGSSQDMKTIFAGVSKQIVGLSDLYVARIEKARLLTNNAFDDDLIRGDFEACKRISSALN